MDEPEIVRGIRYLEDLQNQGQNQVIINGKARQIADLMPLLVARDPEAVSLLSELHTENEAEFMISL